MSTTVTNKTTSVNERSKEVTTLSASWAMVTALLGGTSAMRVKRQTYLPKWPKEDDDAYNDRLAKSTLFPAFKRTVLTLASRPFSKSITLSEDMDSAIKEYMDDVDLQGNNIDVFMAETFKLQTAYGFVGILVEHPKRPSDARTREDDKKLNMRPYLVRVHAENVLGWRTITDGGSVKLSQLRLLEFVEENDGEFGTKLVEQVRVLERGSWRVYRTTTGGGWAIFDEGVTTLKEIPFVALYGERIGFMQSKPPLLELAHLNVKHWQQQSDQDNLMHVVRVPILTARAVGSEFSLVVGSSACVSLGDAPTAELAYVEHTGQAIGAGKTQLDDLKEEMRQSGAELLVLRPGPATATEVASDNAVGMCTLQEMTMTTEDGLNQALVFMGQYIGTEKVGKATLFKDFGAATLAEASASLLVGLKNAGGISGETLFAELKRRGILASDVDWEEEQQRIESEGPPPGSEPDPLNPDDPDAKKEPPSKSGQQKPPVPAKKTEPAAA